MALALKLANGLDSPFPEGAIAYSRRNPNMTLSLKLANGLDSPFPEGAIAYYQCLEKRHNNDLGLLAEPFLRSTERFRDLESFRSSIKDVFIPTAASIVVETGVDFDFVAYDDLKRHQRYYFEVHLQSCHFIDCNSHPEELLEDERLSLKSFPVLNKEDIVILLSSHIAELKALETIKERYALRKSLTTCEFINSDRKFFEIFHLVKCELKLSDAWDNMLTVALQKHISLLHRLDNEKQSSNGVSTKCLANQLEDTIDADYKSELHKFNEKYFERRFKSYQQHLEFKHYATKSAISSAGMKIEHAPDLKCISPPSASTAVVGSLWQPNFLVLKDGLKTQGGNILADRVRDFLVSKDGLKLQGGNILADHAMVNSVFGSPRAWPKLLCGVVAVAAVAGTVRERLRNR